MCRRTGDNDSRTRTESDSDRSREHSLPGHANELYSLLGRLRSAFTRSCNPETVWRLHRRIARQSSLGNQDDGALACFDVFERASSAARMGLWQCDLRSNKLTWSNGTYDLFGFQRGREILRSDVLRRYSEESLAQLEAIRANAIEGSSGFTLDAEIRGPATETRWIRISATVERRNQEPVRLFGIKQDITEEKQLLDRMRHIAEHDGMTGLASRARFHARLAEICEPEGPGGALMLIDLDGFKEVNDRFGHAVGDECLIEIGRRLSALCQSAELVARIGGDEFAVIFGQRTGLRQVQAIAERIVMAAEAPMNCLGHALRVGASIGYALVEREAAATVFSRADRALYAAKATRRRSSRVLARATS